MPALTIEAIRRDFMQGNISREELIAQTGSMLYPTLLAYMPAADLERIVLAYLERLDALAAIKDSFAADPSPENYRRFLQALTDWYTSQPSTVNL